MKKVNHNNKGFSLLELIVVVLIMAIISVSAVMTLSSVNNARAKRAAMVAGNILKQARQNAMGLENKTTGSAGEETSQVFAYFSLEDGTLFGYVYRYDGTNYELISKESLGSDRISIVVSNHSTTSKYTLDDDKGVKIFFKKSTGGIAGVYECTDYDDFTLEGGKKKLACKNATKGTFADTITFDGPNEDAAIVMVTATGRCYLEDLTE